MTDNILFSDEDSRDIDIPTTRVISPTMPHQFELPTIKMPVSFKSNKENQPSTESSSRYLDKLLAEEMIMNKQKPREDVLATQSIQENIDPYAEFDFGEPSIYANKIRSPLTDKDFFQTPTSLRTPTMRAKSLGTSMSEAKRNRLLNRYKKILGSGTNSDDDSSYTPRTTSRARLIKTPQGSLLVNPSTDSKDSTADNDDSTPHRPVLRPRTRMCLEYRDIPLTGIRKSLNEMSMEKESNEKNEEEKQVVTERKVKRASRRRTTAATRSTSKRTKDVSLNTEADSSVSVRKRKHRSVLAVPGEEVDSIAKRVKSNARTCSNKKEAENRQISATRSDETPKGRKTSAKTHGSRSRPSLDA